MHKRNAKFESNSSRCYQVLKTPAIRTADPALAGSCGPANVTYPHVKSRADLLATLDA